MPVGLTTTFQFLIQTQNEVADDILLAALDSPHVPIRDLALRAMLERRSSIGHHEVFRRLPQMDEPCRAIISERPDRLARVVAETMHDGDQQQCAEACEAVLSFRLYDALPVLIGLLSADDNPHRQMAAQTILELTELFYGELCSPEEQTRKRDYDTLRKRITSALEDGAAKYGKHGSKEIIEAFLLIAKQQNVVLRRILQQPSESCHAPLVEALGTSERGGVLRLLLSFLEDPQMPQVVKTTIASRQDLRFLGNLLALFSSGTSKGCAESLSRFDGFAWAKPGHPVLAALSEVQQAQAVALLMATSQKRKELLEVISYLVQEGNVGGRRAAAEALHEFKGPEADIVAIKALNDEDPQVRAHVIKELRPRKVPQAMSLLIRMVDTPHDEVRQALREALPEFNFRHFIVNFDHIAEDLMITTGYLVRKIDAEAPYLLKGEMECLSPVRRRRAVLAAVAMGMIRELEESIIKLLSDEDHMVRIAAAKALADCDTMFSWDALRDALLDRSVIVQEAAERSLLRIAQSLVPEALEDTQEVAT